MMRSTRCRPRRAGARGFTLTELMIVVAIMSILAAIAYPNYVDYVRKSRRADATSLLMRAANRQEQLYNANQNSYLGSMNALGLPDETENGFYTVDVNAAAEDSQWYTITATARGDQVNDLCRVILIDSKGLKTAWSGAEATQGQDVTDTCW